MSAELVDLIESIAALAGVIIAFAALIFAAVQYRDSNNLKNRLTAITADLANTSEQQTKVLEAISTRPVGRLPTYLQVISDTIEKEADKSITILCDHPGYGIYSAPDEFERYSKIIQKKTVDLEERVRLMFLGEESRKVLHAEQFHREDDWDDWKQEDPKRQQLMERFCSSWAEDKEAGDMTREEFLDLLEEAHGDVLENRFGNADKWKTDLPMPLYFWICDDRVAIFSIAVFDKEARDQGLRTVAFRTEDPSLVVALNGIFERYKEQQPETQPV